MQRMFRGLVVTVVLAGLVAAGCKKKTEEVSSAASAEPAAPAAAAATAGGPPAAGPDACAILTKDEIKEAVGLEVTASEHGPSGAPNVCEHKLGDSAQVLITIYISSAKETFDNAPGEPLAGVGDQAKWVESAGMLAVLRGDTSFTVAVVRFDDTPAEQKLEQVKRLAARLLDRL